MTPIDTVRELARGDYIFVYTPVERFHGTVQFAAANPVDVDFHQPATETDYALLPFPDDPSAIGVRFHLHERRITAGPVEHISVTVPAAEDA